MRFIPLSVPNVSNVEKDLINEAIEANWVSSGGPYVTRFENDLKAYVGAQHAIACQSGTAGLHLALKALGIGKNHIVIVPTLTFIATVNPLSYVGATPVFMDCDHRMNMDLSKLKAFLEFECEKTDQGLIHKETSKQVKAVIAVHIFGYMIDMVSLMDLSKTYGFKVIEDATESLGTRHQGCYTGLFGDIGVYSFNGNKIITTGGGGMIVTNNKSYADYMRYLSTQAKDDPVYFRHEEIGFNYRMTTVQACMGIGQLSKLERFIDTKTRNLHIYIRRLKDIDGLTYLNQQFSDRPNHWFYGFLVDEDVLNMSRDALIEALHERGIQTRPVWALIHKQKPYQMNIAYQVEKALEFEKKLINFPCSTNLLEEDIHYVCDQIIEVVALAKKSE